MYVCMYFVRMDEDAPTKRVIEAGNEEIGEEDDLACIGNHKWTEALSSIGVTSWRKRPRNRRIC